MKLTKSEIKKICEKYELGKIKEIIYLKGGMISHLFIFKTDKGKFIVKKLGYSLRNDYWAGQKKIEFAVLDYLHKKKFPYEIPRFIKNKKHKYILRIGKSLFEVYPKIAGRKLIKLQDNEWRELAKAMAIYHKYIENFRPFWFTKNLDNYSWMLEKYKKMSRAKPMEQIDKLMLTNLDFFTKLLKKLMAMDLNKNLLIVHGDFSRSNILFLNGKINGVIDFENLKYAPKAKDIATLINKIGSDGKHFNLFIKEYKKYNKLSKEEMHNIPALILFHNCNLFWWVYLGMKKRPELRYKAMKDLIKRVKRDINFLEEVKDGF